MTAASCGHNTGVTWPPDLITDCSITLALSDAETKFFSEITFNLRVKLFTYFYWRWSVDNLSKVFYPNISSMEFLNSSLLRLDSRPGRVWLVSSRLGMVKSLTFFLQCGYSQTCWYFRPTLWNIAPLTFSLVSSPPPFPVWVSILYTRIHFVSGVGGIRCHRRGGGLR